MPEISEADKYVIDQIRKGNPDGWSQLVGRYQGRLLAFARGRLNRKSEADDLDQETFITFLQNLARFRDEYSLETYLFTILRRKVIDFFRGRQTRTCFLTDVLHGNDQSSDVTPSQLPGGEMSASWYARRDETGQRTRIILAAALAELLDRLKKSENFRDLMIVEMLFYAQLRNKDVAKIAGIDEKHVALIKHRCLKEVREHVVQRLGTAADGGLQSASWETSDTAGSMLTEVWESQRLTCPKRSTIGRYILGTLEKPWHDYIEFHLNKLGCHFCRANLEDLQKQTAEERTAVQDRVMQSTIGFFHRP
jgi:RNA polymerase sigma factor (sigma-70 family)